MVDIKRAQGETPKFHIADEGEYVQTLKEKVQEEVIELLEKPSIGEMVDVLEVLRAVCRHYGWSEEEIQRQLDEKREKRGGFEKRIIIDESVW